MCGICGIASLERLCEDDVSLVLAMNDSMAHRGPDASGEFRDKNVMLAMRRLSIIDIAGGKQPLLNEDNSLALVANGEIYNYVELRRELQGRGHRFRTQSDCETIVHLYEELGADCLAKLRGMFAFALWDKHSRQLFLARDRMGEKPLYLRREDGRLIFASELQTLIKALPRSPCLDPAGVDMYMHYQYVPEPKTIVAGIDKLPPGHFMLVRPAPWQVVSKRYWNIESARPVTHSDPPRRILQELQEVTSLTLRSDVPVGVALSGGMDSNAIAALSAPKYKGRLHAFTVGYQGRPECDERAKAKLIADEFHLPFHEIEIGTDDFVGSFAELVRHCDDPVADMAAFGYFAVMREARRYNVPVMLTGFGGDELFWGYPWVVQTLVDNAKKLSEYSLGPSAYRRVANELTFYEQHPDFKTAEQLIGQLYTPGFRANILAQNSFRPFRVDEPYCSLPVRICRALFDTWLVSNCIVLGDRLSMASSVELRLPLLDYRLVELVMGLRKTHAADYTLGHKAWLKEAVKSILPAGVFNYPKRGFTPPVRQWSSLVIQRYGRLLADGYLVQNGVFDADKVRAFLAQPLSGSVQHFAYKLSVLEAWSRSVLSDEIDFREGYARQLRAPARCSLAADAKLANAAQVAGSSHSGNVINGLGSRTGGWASCHQSSRRLLNEEGKGLMEGRSSGATEQGCQTQVQTKLNHKSDRELLKSVQKQSSPGISKEPSADLSACKIGLFDEEPTEVVKAKELVKSYYHKRMKDVWYSAKPPVWFDHEIDYHMWPGNLFWIERGVRGRMPMYPGCRVLDLCCGDGYYSDVWYSSIAGSIDACDNDKDALRFASQRHSNPKVSYYNVDTLTDAFPRPKYDVITWFGAIEHFSEEHIVYLLQKIHDFLEENGILVGSTPLVPPRSAAEKAAANRQHDREFTSSQDLEGVLKKVFVSVETSVAKYPGRTTCYFECTKSTDDQESDYIRDSYEKVWLTKLNDEEWLRNDGKGRIEYAANYLREKPLAARARLLDIGCGRGTLGLFLKRDLEFFGIDISQKAIKEASQIYKEARCVDMNCQKIPYPDGSFDIVTLLDVIEHVFDPPFLLKEIFRVLKVGGELVLTTPNILWEGHLRKLRDKRTFPKTSGDEFPYDGGHIHFFTYRDCFELLRAAGFRSMIPIGPEKGTQDLEFKEIAVWLSAVR